MTTQSEELVAELGATFPCAHSDKKAIFTAASKAADAEQFIVKEAR